jgi:hypothetical protein
VSFETQTPPPKESDMPEPIFEQNKKPIEMPPKVEAAEGEKKTPKNPIASLQQQVGNMAVQRLLAQRSGDGAAELDEGTASRINHARGGGQSIDTTTGEKMGKAMGADFSDVRVHTGKESHDLNQQVGAEAFTTGKDIFFRESAYDPVSSSGQELIAHELTHVVQQGQGMVSGGGSSMTVNEPGDAHEQQADSVAKSVTTQGFGIQRQDEEVISSLQRQEIPEEEEMQMQPMEEEEELLQPQPIEEEEEEMQMQPIEEEEEELQP